MISQGQDSETEGRDGTGGARGGKGGNGGGATGRSELWIKRGDDGKRESTTRNKRTRKKKEEKEEASSEKKKGPRERWRSIDLKERERGEERGRRRVRDEQVW